MAARIDELPLQKTVPGNAEKLRERCGKMNHTGQKIAALVSRSPAVPAHWAMAEEHER
ncbi:hypothetical protein [Paraburkholderia kururiensis]|uniref:hypothetical protein n=1 Tax=Paraburkholderia kururiensis TaxID=984307 RepID=UPI0018F41E9B|nr:hypothetical protein [Paraburkholderia kururiensis]